MSSLSSRATSSYPRPSRSTTPSGKRNVSARRDRHRHTEAHPSAPSTRPLHHQRRRASQPAVVSQADNRRYAISAPFMSGSEGWSSTDSSWGSSRLASSSDNDDDDDDDDDWSDNDNYFGWDRRKGKARQQDRLEYLDLSLSIPYTVAAMRSRIVICLTALEDKAKTVATRLRAHEEAKQATTTPTSTSASHDMLAHFQSQLALVRDDLKGIFLHLPGPSSASLAHSFDSLPSTASAFTASQAAIAANLHSLSAEWERLASTMGSMLPSTPSALVTAVQCRFDALHDTMTSMSLRNLWDERDQLQWATGKMGEVSSSLMESMRESATNSRLRAGSMVDTMLEMERAAYARACELAQGGRLITYDQLPELWRNNEHIFTGYRFIPVDDPVALLRSTLSLHNETLNIHTHLIGIALILPLFWAPHDDDATSMDRLIRAAYLGSALKCLFLSVAWHTCAGSSDLCLFTRSACADYSGVAVLIAASVVSIVYGEFFCQPRLALFYSTTTVLVGLAGAVLPWQAWFNKRENKGKRIAMFLGICFTSLLPFFHASHLHGFTRTFIFLSPIIPSVLAYIAGLIVYATNCPESLLPGKFDLWGHSHQWWHCAILAAIILHWKAMAAFSEGRVEYSCQL